MISSQHEQDADRIIRFFHDAKSIYKNSSHESLISFCLQVFGIEHYDIRELEESYKDLQTIVMLISRDLEGSKYQDFNIVANGYINKYYKWLVASYNGQISDTDGDILFNEDHSVNFEMFSSKKILSADYFTVVSDYAGCPKKNYLVAELDNDESKTLGCDIIVHDEKLNKMLLIERSVPWTDCCRLWIGNKKMLMIKLNGKYRKAKEKRLREILNAAYEKYGDKLLFNTISIESGSLDKKDAFVLDFNTPDEDCLFSIRRK